MEKLGDTAFVKIAVKSKDVEKEIIIKKSTLCWFLSTNQKKLSSDRLDRVKSFKITERYSKKK